MSAPLGLDRMAVDALGWTLLHFVWQGVLIAMAFAAVDRLLSRRSANVRYLVACGTLLVMLIVPIATFVVVRDAGTPLTGAGSSLAWPEAPSAVAGPGASGSLPAAKHVRAAKPGPDRVASSPPA